MGTLGLAWTGDLKNAGGVCEKNGVSKFEGKSILTDLKSGRLSFLFGLKKRKKRTLSRKAIMASIIFPNFAALSWQHEVAEHRNSDFTELREARTARRFSRHFGARDRP